MRTIMLAALLVAAVPAAAQEPPTTIRLGVHTGTFEEPGDVDRYRIKLEQGQNYAFGVQVGPGFGDVVIKGPTGTPICSASGGEGESDGCEFRAGRDGFFAIAITEGGETGQGYPLAYVFKLQKDCRDDDRTRCRLTPGHSTSVPLSYGEEVDWIKLALLTKGRSYTATLTASVPATLSVRTRATVIATEGPDGVTFKADGDTMFLVVSGDEPQNLGGTWKVSLR